MRLFSGGRISCPSRILRADDTPTQRHGTARRKCIRNGSSSVERSFKRCRLIGAARNNMSILATGDDPEEGLIASW